MLHLQQWPFQLLLSWNPTAVCEPTKTEAISFWNMWKKDARRPQKNCGRSLYMKKMCQKDCDHCRGRWQSEIYVWSWETIIITCVKTWNKKEDSCLKGNWGLVCAVKISSVFASDKPLLLTLFAFAFGCRLILRKIHLSRTKINCVAE